VKSLALVDSSYLQKIIEQIIARNPAIAKRCHGAVHLPIRYTLLPVARCTQGALMTCVHARPPERPAISRNGAWQVSTRGCNWLYA